jgi:hypothetical protein
MLVEYKQRNWDLTKRVKVYRNLHQDCLSIQAYCKDAKGWRVWSHCYGGNYILEDMDTQVNETNRQKVIRQKSKNVHAFITGYWTGFTNSTPEENFMNTLYYNPYKQDRFTVKESHGIDITHRELYANEKTGVIGNLKVFVI